MIKYLFFLIAIPAIVVVGVMIDKASVKPVIRTPRKAGPVYIHAVGRVG